MLSAIKETLAEAIQYETEAGSVSDKFAVRKKRITNFMSHHEYIMNADVCRLCGVSSATANRILNALVAEGLIEKRFIRGHWTYIPT
jgi:Fic family protein